MTSQRHSVARVDDDVLLDAARHCVLSVGVRRTTLTDIARRAGTSRMTVYRRFPGVTSVVAALMTREFGALLGEISAAADGAGTGDVGVARDRLVAAAVRAGARLVRDPLLTSVLDRDAELLLPYLVERIGSTQRLTEKFIAELLVAGHVDGSIRVAPVGAQARLFYLTVQAFVLSHRPATADVPPGELLVELAATLDHGLRPGGHA
jgi:AcrR family transcriptional regulator